MPITLKEADEIVRAARANAESVHINISVAVVDQRGDLVAFVRMDGARHFTADVSRGKATVSAFFGQPSGVLAERAGNPVFQSLNQINQGHLMFAQGAVPITRDGEIVGAVGVSGGTGQQDEDAARAGLAAV